MLRQLFSFAPQDCRLMSRHVAATHDFGRLRSEADIEPKKPRALVEFVRQNRQRVKRDAFLV